MAHQALKDANIDINQIVHITRHNRQFSRRFNTYVYDYRIQFNADLIESDDLGELFTLIYTAFEHLFDLILRDFHIDDYVRIVILSEFLDTPISLPYIRVCDVTVDQIFDAIANVLNSQEEFSLTNGFDIHILRTILPTGSGKISRASNLSFQTWLEQKTKAVIQINNSDNLCLSRAVVVAIESVEHLKVTKKHFSRFVTAVGPRSLQTEAAVALHRSAALSTAKNWYGLDDVKQIQNAIVSDYIIHVYDKFSGMVYDGAQDAEVVDQKHIYLLYHENHFMVIKSIKAFFGRSYFCDICQKPHDSIIHRCGVACKFCHNIRCLNTARISLAKQKCSECGMDLLSDACKMVHKCIKADVCSKCKKYVQVKHLSSHKRECNKFRCRVCCNFFDFPKEKHECFVQQLPSVERSFANENDGSDDVQTSDGDAELDQGSIKPTDLLFYYDCETTFAGEDHHIVNLIVCATPDKILTFKGETMGKDFFDMISSYLKKSKSRLIFLAHNASSFDSPLILREAYNQGLQPAKIFYRSSKILLMELNRRVRFICSYLFLPFSLRTLAKNFGLKNQKLYFPYLINRNNYESGVIPFPDEELYNPQSLSTEEAYTEFKNEYNKMKARYTDDGLTFDIDAENETYCKVDVGVLKEVCESFSKEFENMNHVAPFSTGITLPSVCLTVYRMQHLPSSTLLPVFPQYGIETRTRYSKIGSTWLQYESMRKGIYIQAAHNVGEVTVGPYKVDGFHKDTSSGICTIYEFFGCLVHSCGTHYPDPTGINPLSKLTHREVRLRNSKKLAFIANTPYRLVLMWECEFRYVVAADDALQQMFKEIGLLKLNRLIPRQALYGGRVECFKLYVEKTSTKSIDYYDFVSLYPTVMVSGDYSVGMPQILYGFELPPAHLIDFTEYRGLLYIKVLPPKNIGIGVLPVRSEEFGLLFALCNACALTCQQTACIHSDEERALTGVWSHIELNVAITEKYVVLEVYEIYNFTQSSREVFKSYVQTFTAAKIANSGYPSGVVSDSEKEKYVNDMYDQTGILIAKESIVKNPTRKAIAKLCLNSLWGKFSQRTNQKTTKIIREPAEFYRLHNNPALEIENLFMINEDLMHVTYKHLEDTEVRGTTCLMVAIDSVVFETQNGEWKPESGNFLGQLQDEIQNKFSGGYLNRFVALGCKTYGMEIVDADKNKRYELHCKGISLNLRTKKVINFESMLNLLRSDRTGTLVMEDPYFIRRLKRESKLASVYLKKKLRFTFKKRRVNCETFETVPLGYVS